MSDRIDFLFSEEEQRSYHALLQDPKRTDFSLSVRMGEGLEPLAATAHFRGQSSYIDILEDVIENRLTEAMFQAACERTGNELSRFLSRPQVSAAMIELIATNPQTIEPVVAKAEIQKALQELLFNFSRERVKLVERIAAYRGRRLVLR